VARLLGGPPRRPESEIQQFHSNVARSVQVVLEEVLLEKNTLLYSRFPSDHLCMAGGVALNVVSNSRCLREGPSNAYLFSLRLGMPANIGGGLQP